MPKRKQLAHFCYFLLLIGVWEGSRIHLMIDRSLGKANKSPNYVFFSSRRFKVQGLCNYAVIYKQGISGSKDTCPFSISQEEELCQQREWCVSQDTGLPAKTPESASQPNVSPMCPPNPLSPFCPVGLCCFPEMRTKTEHCQANISMLFSQWPA